MQSTSANLSITVVGIAVLLVLGGAVWFGTTGAPDSARSTTTVALLSTGGMTVHVSGEVVDPGLVVVPAGSRVADAVAAAGGATSDAVLQSLNLADHIRDGDHLIVPHADSGVSSVVVDVGIDLNSASVAQLTELAGVGPVLAQRIVDHRESVGRFASVEDLLDVAGIGEAKLESMRGQISKP